MSPGFRDDLITYIRLPLKGRKKNVKRKGEERDWKGKADHDSERQGILQECTASTQFAQPLEGANSFLWC